MTEQPSLGAYGIRYLGAEAAARFLLPMPADAPVVGISLRVDATARPPAPVPPSVEFEFLEGGRAVVQRDPLRAELTLPDVPDPADLAHPMLTAVAAQVAQWQGWQVLHGAVVTLGGWALAVVGDREAGKTTLMAACTLDADLEVMADDLVVVEHDLVKAGPRSLDLRSGGAEAFPSLATERVRGSTRERVVLPTPPTSARIMGTVVLDWGPLALRRVPARERLPLLLPHLPVTLDAVTMRNALGCASRPVWVLSRPRDLTHLPQTVTLTKQLLASAVRAPQTT